MGRYQRMSLIEREELSRMLATGASLRAIGQALSQAPSTVSSPVVREAPALRSELRCSGASFVSR